MVLLDYHHHPACAPNLSTPYYVTPTLHVFCHDKNMNLKKNSTNFYPNLDQASSLQAIYIRILNSGISENFLNFLPDRPEAYPDFFQIFIRIGIRNLTWHSRVLFEHDTCQIPTYHLALKPPLRNEGENDDRHRWQFTIFHFCQLSHHFRLASLYLYQYKIFYSRLPNRP